MPLPEPMAVELATINPDTLNCLLGAGILNPGGPTLAVLAAAGADDTGTSIPVVVIVLNPFLQAVYQVGVANLGDEWDPAVDLEPFFPLGLLGCPTLLLGNRGMGRGQKVDLFAAFVATFEDGKRQHRLVQQFPGEPVRRISAALGMLSAELGIGPEKPGGRSRMGKKGGMGTKEAREFASHQLKVANIRREIEAFLFFWQGSIDNLGLDSDLAEGAMKRGEFLEFFALLARTLDVPLK